MRTFRHRLRGTSDRFSLEHAHIWVDTDDGVRLAGTLLGPPDARDGVVLVHGFMGWRTKPSNRLLAETLARRFRVLAFDLRGHGQSGGVCTGGEQEPRDVAAAVGTLRDRGVERVATVGWSLGGLSVIRAQARRPDADAVVAISAPAIPGETDTKAVRRASWFFLSRLGRSIARRVLGTRILLPDGPFESPVEAIGRIAPTPILLVHGSDDRYFPVAQAEMLFERAGDPKRLLILPDFGHAEDGFTPVFAARLVGDIVALLAAAPEDAGAAPTGAAAG